MIISHKYRFVFIKTIKTAGSSVEVALSPACGEADVFTPLSPANPCHRPRNYYSRWPVDVLCAKVERARKIVHRDSMFFHRFYYEHMGAKRIRKLTPGRVWRTYFKFCFDRNPWDSVVSFYYWKTRNQEKREDFDAFIHRRPLPRNWDLYTIGGEIEVDHLARYEDLDEEWRRIVERLGLPNGIVLGNEKGGIREPGSDYRGYYSASSRDYIAALFKEPIEYLGYDF